LVKGRLIVVISERLSLENRNEWKASRKEEAYSRAKKEGDEWGPNGETERIRLQRIIAVGLKCLGDRE